MKICHGRSILCSLKSKLRATLGAVIRVKPYLSKHSLTNRPVVLKLVGSIEPNRCHASIHRTLSYNQERIQKILERDAVLN